MFDFITDPIENFLEIADGITKGYTPTKRQVAKLLADGLTVYGISEATGISIGILEEIIKDIET